MKQSDIFTIIIIASIGMVAAFFASNALLGNPDELSMKHKTITPISTEIVEPDPETFNVDAINPTVEVYVGQCEDVDQNGILDKRHRRKLLRIRRKQMNRRKLKNKRRLKIKITLITRQIRIRKHKQIRIIKVIIHRMLRIKRNKYDVINT